MKVYAVPMRKLCCSTAFAHTIDINTHAALLMSTHTLPSRFQWLRWRRAPRWLHICSMPCRRSITGTRVTVWWWVWVVDVVMRGVCIGTVLSVRHALTQKPAHTTNTYVRTTNVRTNTRTRQSTHRAHKAHTSQTHAKLHTRYC